MSDKPLTKLLVLDDAQVTAMLRNPAVIEVLPFLRNLSVKAAAPAKKCCGQKTTEDRTDYSTARRVIDQLSPVDRDRLKALLRTERIRLLYAGPDGKTIKSTW